MSQSESFYRLDKRVALVTGAGQGIGEAIARRLASAGAKLVIFDRDLKAAQTVAESLGGIAIAGDVTRETDVQAAVTKVEKELGSLDIVVNNAGITGRVAPIVDLSLADFQAVV